MFDSPYQTLACRNYRTVPVAQALSRELVNGSLTPVKMADGRVIDTVLEVLTYPSEVPTFTQPMEIKPPSRDVSYIVIDQRGHVSNKAGGEPKVLLRGDYEMLRLYARLMLAWKSDASRRRELLNVSVLPLQVQERTLSGSLVRRLGLEMHEQMHISAIAGWYGVCQYMDEEQSEDRDSLYPLISRITRIQTAKLYELLDTVGYIGGLVDFVEALKVQLPTPRVQAITPAILVTAVGGIWYGATARETIAVSLEYPPTWIALIATALNYSGYRSTILAKTVAELDKRDAGRNFLRGLSHYIGD